MSKVTTLAQSRPAQVIQALTELGENLALARVRRRASQRDWALRIGVSVPTLIRMERGDAGVGVGVYATALWLMGRAQALGEVAAPVVDLGALEADVRAAKRSRAVRQRASVEANLARRGAVVAAAPLATTTAAPTPAGVVMPANPSLLAQ
jgi:transcriptional regulator with XRE-family HTH domain